MIGDRQAKCWCNCLTVSFPQNGKTCYNRRMSETEQDQPTIEEKRPFQFSLRTMFLVTFVWAVICAIGASLGPAAAWFAACVGCSATGAVLCLCNRTRLGTWLIGTGFMVLCLSGLLLPARETAREASRRAKCASNLKQISLAMIAYADEHGTYPPAYIVDESGNPMHSWRVLILPQMDRNDIYARYNFDEPWDGPNNRKLHSIIVSCYRCPSDGSATPTDTCYIAAVGPNAMFPGGDSIGFDEVTDGLSSTIMIVETSGSGIHWMEPRDLDVAKMDPAATTMTKGGPGISSDHPAVVNVLFANATPRMLAKEDLTPEMLQALLSRNGGEDVSDIVEGY